jgi:DNA-dependent RNA polymerase auxiliary subunit epsilon
MKLYVICQGNYDGTDILGVYDNQEKAEELTGDSKLYIEEFELNKEIFFLYRVDILLNGQIDECYKVFDKDQKERVLKREEFLTVFTSANNKEQAIEIAKQKLKENTTVKMVEKIEWKQ